MKLSDAIYAYLADRVAKGRSTNTVKNDRSTLLQLLADVGNIQVHSLGPVQIDRFWAAHPEWKPTTWNLKRIVLMSFFDWCRMRGHMPRTMDPLEGTRKRRIPRTQKVLIPQGEFEKVLELAEKPRDRVVVALGLYLFARVSEIGALRWRDIDFGAKTVTIYRQKTDQYDMLPMCEELEAELRRWHFEYGRQAGEVPRPSWFVTPRYSKALWAGTGTGFQMIEAGKIQPDSPVKSLTPVVKTVLERAGYDDQGEGGHTLRRSGATALYHELARVGHDRAIRLCQAMLGHANIATTEIYLSLDLDRKARNDLLAGRRMFAVQEADVMEIGHGREDIQDLRM